MKFLLATLFFIATSANAIVCFPRTSKMYPMSINPAKNSSEEAKFNKAIDDFEAYAKPLIKKFNFTDLQIERLWKDSTINADTWHEGSVIKMHAYGGLYRHPLMTVDAYKQVMCHELGHSLGGAPFYTGEDMSVEGQADYYSTDSCAIAMGLPWSASQQLADTLADLGGEVKPNIKTPDTTVVNKTYEGHPNAQCRLDTYYDGSLHTDRPRCWFAPNAQNLSPIPDLTADSVKSKPHTVNPKKTVKQAPKK
jgi:hypothetical protein